MSLLYEQIAGLPLQIERYTLEERELKAGGWNRLTTTVHLHGAGHSGLGEDVNYNADEQRAFQLQGPRLDLRGRFTLDAFSRHLDTLDLLPTAPGSPANRDFRRWAFESAALDLALRQSATTLAEALDRVPQPIHFVASLSLGTPATVDPLLARRQLKPELEFKIDYGSTWTPELVEQLRKLGGVRVVDLKGLYVGSFTGPPPHAGMYETIAAGLPNAILEDPSSDEECINVLKPFHERLSWDAVIHSVEDVDNLPIKPLRLNMKPSRLGRLRTLFSAYDHFREDGIQLYGGGQYELGVGRGQIQHLASLFHGDAPNDVAPIPYHSLSRAAEWPDSPLAPPPATAGFR